MFKGILSKSPQKKYTVPLSSFRPISPRPNRTPIKNQIRNLQRSPIRNRPSDIQPLQTYINNHLTNRNLSPIRTRSPLRVQHFYQQKIVNLTPRRSTLRQQNRLVSPSRVYNTNRFQVEQQYEKQQFWRRPSEICGNQPSYIQPKQNSKLFTKLIKNLKSLSDQPQDGAEYSQRRYQVQTANVVLKRQTSLFENYLHPNPEKQLYFHTQTKQKPQQLNYEYGKSVNSFADVNKMGSEQSFGIIPFIESITPSKTQGLSQQRVQMTLNPSIVQSFGQIVLEKRKMNQDSVNGSISDNDRVIQSLGSSIMSLNMSLTK